MGYKISKILWNILGICQNKIITRHLMSKSVCQHIIPLMSSHCIYS